MLADVLERTCCLADCYTLEDCKVAVSARCQLITPECALGQLS